MTKKTATPGNSLWHTFTIEQAFSALESNYEGLSEADAIERKAKYGANLLPTQKKASALLRFFKHFHNILTTKLFTHFNFIKISTAFAFCCIRLLAI